MGIDIFKIQHEKEGRTEAEIKVWKCRSIPEVKVIHEARKKYISWAKKRILELHSQIKELSAEMNQLMDLDDSKKIDPILNICESKILDLTLGTSYASENDLTRGVDES